MLAGMLELEHTLMDQTKLSEVGREGGSVQAAPSEAWLILDGRERGFLLHVGAVG